MFCISAEDFLVVETEMPTAWRARAGLLPTVDRYDRQLEYGDSKTPPIFIVPSKYRE